MSDKYMDGVCDWCNEKTALYEDNKRCEECDSNVVECSVCRCEEDLSNYGHCRHVFRDSNWEPNGSGIPWGDRETIKESFLKLCSLMPKDFELYLHQAIRAGDFSTFLVAPLIGDGGILDLGGMPDRWRHRDSEWLPDYGLEMLKIGQGDDAEECADGYRWLVSLYRDKTPEANATTLRWLALAMGRKNGKAVLKSVPIHPDRVPS